MKKTRFSEEQIVNILRETALGQADHWGRFAEMMDSKRVGQMHRDGGTRVQYRLYLDQAIRIA